MVRTDGLTPLCPRGLTEPPSGQAVLLEHYVLYYSFPGHTGEGVMLVHDKTGTSGYLMLMHTGADAQESLTLLVAICPGGGSWVQ